MRNPTAIGPLTKVSLALTPHDSAPGDLTGQTDIQFEFVYGIGGEGLSEFEKDLHGLSVGARMEIRVKASEMQTYFEHLRRPLLNAVKVPPPLDFALVVLSVRAVTDRELVHALANRESSGCDCGCDCAC